MKKRFYIFINGILNRPENVNGWTDEAESWIENNTNFAAQKYEYKCGVLTRRIFQKERVNQLHEVIDKLHGEVVLVGHSNGCDIIERLIRIGVAVKEIHLIAAASEHDFRKNRYNLAMAQGTVGKIFIYCSPEDEYLTKARISTYLLGWCGLGYGYMGLVGPKYVLPAFKDRVQVIYKNYKHSEWVNKTNLDNTLRMVTHAIV